MLIVNCVVAFVLASCTVVRGNPAQFAFPTELLDAGTLTDHSPTRTVAPQPRATVVNCPPANETALETATHNADALVHGAMAYLTAHPFTAVSARYQTWFGGAPTFAQHSRVSTVFATLNDTSFAVHEYTCVPEAMCTGLVNDAAYTTPWTPGRVFVCPKYFARPATGSASQAGLLVHLATQWATVGDTGHWAIGEANSKALALRNPFLAVDNGDSFEYFAENTPPLA